MIKNLIVIVLLLISQLGIAQNKSIDSLKNLLEKNTIPIERFDLINKTLLELAGRELYNVDSAYSVELVKIAQELDNDSLLSIGYNWIGSFFYLTNGDNSTSLEYYFKALPLAEEAEDKRRISSIYFDIALVYFDLLDYDAALLNIRKGGDNLPDTSSALYDFMLGQYLRGMANYYLLIKEADSAFYYVQEGNKVSDRMGGIFSKSIMAIFQGSVYALLGNLEFTDKYFDQAKQSLPNVQRTSIKILFYNNYIPYLIKNNRISEATKQSKDLLFLGEENNNNTLKLAGTNFLRQVYDLKNQTDSAYYYSRKASEINALIFSQNNNNKIQALGFKEQLRSFEEQNREAAYINQLKQYGLMIGLAVILLIAFILYRNNRQQQKTNKTLNQTLSNLKSTQTQLIHSEKMASLGELTAGIAHEIQNPLNFVNNFSEVNTELAEELKAELEKGDIEEAKVLSANISENEKKINHHGQRASSIVKGMLEHSRTGSGEKELTDINKLADEYLRLSYHGLRAKDKSFNAEFKTDFDDTIPNLKVVPQDIGRVLLNLINNAFQACTERSRSASTSLCTSKASLSTSAEDNNYKPLVTVGSTSYKSPSGDLGIKITVKDNGTGIPDEIKDRIFEPFFTTKPTGQGTGLGLSMSYDIITKGHGGELKVESKVGEGSEFIIQLKI